MNGSKYYFDSPHAAVKGPPLDAVRWTEGFWAERFDLCHKTVIPSMKKALEDPTNSARLSNLRIAAGLEDGEHEGTNWSDGDCCKWMEAMAHVYGVTRDPDLDRQMDEVIEWIAGAQEEDGYLSTQITLDPGKERWQIVRHHELYNIGHCITAACVHNEATGKDNFLRIAVKLADYLYRTFEPRPKKLAHFGENPANIMALVDLYRVTGNKRHLELAEIFVDMRGSLPGGTDQNQDRKPFREETEAVGHAVKATYLYAGAADVVAETGEKDLQDTLDHIWSDVVTHKLYVTGGVGADHRSASNRSYDKVHESFGLPYALPHSTAYMETCANIGQATWARRMLALKGTAQYADVMEQVLYNAGLSGMSIDGTRFCYTNPLRWHGADHRLLSQDAHERWFTARCYCCPPQVTRTLAKVHRWAYGLSDHAVWVHLFGASRLQTELADGTIVLEQATDYPWDGEVLIQVKEAPPEPVALKVRVPGWAVDPSASVNDTPLEARPATYLEIERTWSPGDQVKLTLPMQARLLEANPQVETALGQVAVARGPIIYCLEEADLPKGAAIADIRMPRDAQFVPRHDPDLLGGVTVIESTARARNARSWNGALYRDLDTVEQTEVPILLIPYYAWHNRGDGEMTVWLPLD